MGQQTVDIRRDHDPTKLGLPEFRQPRVHPTLFGTSAATQVLVPAGGTVVIGKDTRLSGYMFESALESGFVAAGADVLLLGPLPTPGIAYLTKFFEADLGVVISASHNSYQDNGIKFFDPLVYLANKLGA